MVGSWGLLSEFEVGSTRLIDLLAREVNTKLNDVSKQPCETLRGPDSEMFRRGILDGSHSSLAKHTPFALTQLP